MSVLNATKYPMSLSFALKARGPALLPLAAWDRRTPRWTARFAPLGRVPMFYHVAHLWALHALTLLAALRVG